MAPSDTLRHLRKQSKTLLRDFHASDDDAVRSVRAVFRQSSKLTLQQAQHVIARQYGFEHWQALSRATPPQLRQAISHYRSSADASRGNKGRIARVQAGTTDSDRPVLQACESFAVNWNPEKHAGLSFLRPGKARERWSRLEKLGVSLAWSRVGRINKTRHGWEWLMVMEYGSLGAATRQVPSFAFDDDGESIVNQSMDCVARMRTIEFLRRNNTCCRLLFDTRRAGSQAELINELIDGQSLRHIPKIKNRVFIL